MAEGCGPQVFGSRSQARDSIGVERFTLAVGSTSPDSLVLRSLHGSCAYIHDMHGCFFSLYVGYEQVDIPKNITAAEDCPIVSFARTQSVL